MPEDNIEQSLKTMIVERLFLKVGPDEIQDDDDLLATYGIDSVSLFELVVGLEEVYGVKMEDEEFSIEVFTTVESLAEFVRKKLAESAQ